MHCNPYTYIWLWPTYGSCVQTDVERINRSLKTCPVQALLEVLPAYILFKIDYVIRLVWCFYSIDAIHFCGFWEHRLPWIRGCRPHQRGRVSLRHDGGVCFKLEAKMEKRLYMPSQLETPIGKNVQDLPMPDSETVKRCRTIMVEQLKLHGMISLFVVCSLAWSFQAE